MATTIRLKNSVVKDKVPAADDIQIGELCVGAHADSPALFFKDNADNIVKIEPGSGTVPSPTPPESPEAGDLWFDSNNDTLNFWDGTGWVALGEAGDSPVQSVNTQTGDVVLDAADVGALASGDDVSELNNDAGYITLAQVPSALVSSVNTKTGDVVLDADDVGALKAGDDVSELNNDAGYVAAGDDVSELNNDAGYITAGDVPSPPVTSVNTATGDVVLSAADVGAATTAQGAKADSALQSGDDISELNNDAGYLTGTAADGAYLPLAGGNLTGDLTLGTDKITLDATDGSITSASNILANNGVTVDGGSSLSTGFYYRDDSESYGIALYSGGSSQTNRKVLIKTDGSAGFASSGRFGVVTEGHSDIKDQISIYPEKTAAGTAPILSGYDPSWATPTSQILTNGWASFLGRVTVGDRTTENYTELYESGGIRCYRAASNSEGFGIYNPSGLVAGINMDGSAEFKGTVTATTFNIDALPALA